ncbi:hypothetical protein [Olivibacter sp. XZL3]|uniref:hypothetical protein n=1 Tax=Olivibacter sp. XZL3 TaxID=1735116 RepID=UPI0010651E24|nr:hypothetical protein [Olivibacter sp. XZL3]
MKQPGQELPDTEFEIERYVLLNMLFETVKNDVDFIFNNSITSLYEEADHIEVAFKDGFKN